MTCNWLGVDCKAKIEKLSCEVGTQQCLYKARCKSTIDVLPSCCGHDGDVLQKPWPDDLYYAVEAVDRARRRLDAWYFREFTDPCPIVTELPAIAPLRGFVQNTSIRLLAALSAANVKVAPSSDSSRSDLTPKQ
jgi:hypothetical protein